MKGLKPSKESIAKDINTLADLLIQYNIVSECQGLYEAYKEALALSSNKHWEYTCIDLKFPVNNSVGGTIPQKVNYYEIILNLEICGLYEDEKVFSNPLTKLCFDLELFGINDKTADLYAAWHFDKHISGGDPCSFNHPEYHLTFGGNKMESKGDVFGDSLIFPSPRIFYPPMDAILAIDYILQHYFPLDFRSDLMKDPQYIDVVCNSQNRLWKPYFTSISSTWFAFPGISIDNNFHYQKLCPFIN